jgi:preprotein translocase subunit SecE
MSDIHKPAIPNTAPVQFLKEVIAELKRVTWPTRDETVKLTFVVIAISVMVGAFIGGLDAFFLSAQKLLLGR